MPINLDVIIDTPDQSVDMKAGLESLQGASDATRRIAQTILTEKIPDRLSYAGKVRTNLKKSFKGSYGQVFDLEICDGALLKKFNSIGRSAFLELIQFFLNEALYQDTKQLSVRAQNVLEKLGGVADDLVEKVRASSLEQIHCVPEKFGHDIRLRFRKSAQEQIVIAKFDKETAKVLDTTEDTKNIDLVASITRLNINTGNGRLVEEGNFDTVAFGFGADYKKIKFEAKKIFSENLDHNNGIAQEHWEKLKLSARPIRLRDGKIIKYIVRAFENE